VDLTIRAFSQVAASTPGSELVVVGDGPERQSLAALVDSMALTDRVVFAGACPSELVRQHYERSHIFVQHSITHSSGWVEGFGVTIVEAAAAGLPVVVSRSGGIGPQVVEGETGMLVAEGDVSAMARAMSILAQDCDLRVRMGLAGRRHVERNFDSRAQIGKLERVLFDAVRATSSAPGLATEAGDRGVATKKNGHDTQVSSGSSRSESRN
jgi:glycosyltransferase involved in cell wall biosynthesis